MLILNRFIFVAVILYTYNKFSVSFNAFIPINIFTIFFVVLFGVPGIIGLIVFNILFF